MPLDHFVTLGRSGLQVSPLCLDAMTFGEESLQALNDLVHSGKVRYRFF